MKNILTTSGELGLSKELTSGLFGHFSGFYFKLVQVIEVR